MQALIESHLKKSETVSSKKVRTLLIGDIHGCYKELKELLLKVNYNPVNDRLISLGDLVHKGPKSWKVLEFFYNNKAEVIMGNHDLYFLNSMKGIYKPYAEGEKIISKSVLTKKKLIKWMDTWPTYIEADEFIAVHASLNPAKKNYSATTKHDMTSARYFNIKTKKMIVNTSKRIPDIKPWYHVFDPQKVNNKKIVFGHWAQPLPRFYKNFRCLDTGCCYGGNLSCLILPDDKLVKVPSQQPKKFNY